MNQLKLIEKQYNYFCSRLLLAYRAFKMDPAIYARQTPFLGQLCGKTIVSVHYCGGDDLYSFDCADGLRVYFRIRNTGLWRKIDNILESL